MSSCGEKGLLWASSSCSSRSVSSWAEWKSYILKVRCVFFYIVASNESQLM